MNTLGRKLRSLIAGRVTLWVVVLLLVLLALGAHYTVWTVLRVDREMRADFLAQAQRMAQGLSVECILALSGSESDLALPEYQRLKQQLGYVKQAWPSCRFVYLMGRRADGISFFFADSEAPGSEGYSPPGQVYDEADAAQAAILGGGKPVVEGPSRDRWGTWMSASVPLEDRQSRTTCAVLGVDSDARAWRLDLCRAALRPVLLTLMMAVLLLASVTLLLRRQRLGHSAPLWLKRLEPILAVVVGLTLTVFVAWRVREREVRVNRGSLVLLADSETHRVAHALQDVDTTGLPSLARFLESDEEVIREEFQHFIEPLARNPAVFSWEWLPAVPAAERARFEQSVRAAGEPTFGIWEKDAQGERVAAFGREIYYPVLHVTRPADNGAAVGFDVGSEPIRRAALEAAARSGLAVATDPITLVQDARPQNGMAVFQPVFQRGEPPRLRGFAVAVLRMDRVVGAMQDKAALHVSLSLLRPDLRGQLLASSCADDADGVTLPVVSRPVAAFDKVFLVTAQPHGDFVVVQPHAAAAVAVLRGLALTAALAFVVGAPVRRREELERLVAEQIAELRKEKDRLAATLGSIGDGVLETDGAGQIVSLNSAAERLTGWSTAEAKGRPLGEVFRIAEAQTPATAENLAQRVLREGVAVDPADTATLVAMDRTERHVSNSCAPIRGVDRGVVGTVLVFRDVTREYHARRLAELRFALLEYAPFHSLDELMGWALDHIAELLDSPIGFYHLVDADQKSLTLQQWSTRTQREFCQAAGKGRHYAIDQAGVWADCLREGRPVIHNDYAALPQRKGLPEGHARVIRELVVPVRRNGLVVAVLGLGNKPVDYTESDAEIVALLADVTWHVVEKRRADDALQESQVRYNQLAELSRIYTWEVDPEGLFSYVSPSVERVLGYRPDELVGKMHFYDLHPAAGRAEFRAAALAVTARQEPFTALENAVLTRDGQQLWMLTNGIPLLGADGEFRGYRGSDMDITERKRLEMERQGLLAAAEQSRSVLLSMLENEKRLAAERDLLAAGIEQAAEVVLITDAAGVVRYVNPAFEAATGYTREEIVGQSPRLLRSGEHDEVFYRGLWDTISSGKVWAGRFVNRRKDGTLCTEDATIAPVRDGEGRIASYVAVKRDVTEHLRLSAQLQQAQKMESVGRLAGGVAHDFNNLLMGIMNYVELCRDGLVPDHPVREYLDEISTEAQRSTNLTRQLLAFASKQLMVPTVLDLNDAVAKILNLLRRLIGENIDLAWIPGVNPWLVKMDPGQVDQILANLCINARDAIAGAGTITIATGGVTLSEAPGVDYPGAIPGDYVLLSVSDDGCGMSKEVLDHIFEPFFTTKDAGKGTGLGLATVYGIVRQNRGAISVLSEPGKGTTFRIYLPRVSVQDLPVEAAKPASARPRGNETILLVEDEKSLLVTTRMFLENLGYTVLPAEAPDAAIALAGKHAGAIHLLLTDVIMPGMSGRDLAVYFRTLRPGLPCLYMSGYTADVIAQTDVLEAEVELLVKPFSRDTLAQKVRETLDRGKQA